MFQVGPTQDSLFNDLKTEAAINRHGLTLEGKIKVINDVQEVLASVQDAVVRTLYIKQLSERLDIEETARHPAGDIC